MIRHNRALSEASHVRSGVVFSMTLVALLSGCSAPDTYPCQKPDPGHLGPDRKPDPCHFEDPDSPARAITTFFNTVAEPFCEAVYACCNDTMFLQDFAGGTLEDCKVRWADGSGLGSRVLLELKTSLVNGQTLFDPTEIDACVAQLNARIMPTPATGVACVEPAPFLLLNTCLGAAFRGQIAPGDACVSWPGLPEDLSFAACRNGRCVNGKCVPFLKSGDVCYIGAYPSDPADTVCNFVQEEWCKGGTGLMGTCGARIETGDVCDPGNDVAYLCKSLECAQNHVCGPLKSDGSACDVF